VAEGPWQRAVALDRLGEQPTGAFVGGRRLCLGRASEGYFAIDDTCPHAGGSLSEGIVAGEDVICPLHAYAFDVRSGHCPDDPACSIRAYAVREHQGYLEVRLARDEARPSARTHPEGPDAEASHADLEESR